MFINNQLGKGISYREIVGKFGVSLSTVCEKIYTAGTDENLARQVPMLGHGARVLPLELVPVPGHAVPKLVLEQQQKAMFRLVPVNRALAPLFQVAIRFHPRHQ